MLLQPGILALLLADGVSVVLLLAAALFALRLLRHWDLQSGSIRQIRLERGTALVTTFAGFVLLLQMVLLPLFVVIADRLSIQFVGAMCAVGSLNVNPFGFPALLLRIGLFFAAAGWLFMHSVDRQAFDYPLTRPKYALLLLIAPLAVATAAVQLAYFLNLRADVITSCCGALFSQSSEAVTADLAALPPVPMMLAFYGLLGITLVAGSLVWIGRIPAPQRAAVLFAGLALLTFPVAIAAVITFVAPYVYEQPHHHCPFCLLKAEYGWIGYALYLPLFTGTALAAGLALTLPLARAVSLHPVLARTVPRTAAVGTLLLALFVGQVVWLSWFSNLRLL